MWSARWASRDVQTDPSPTHCQLRPTFAREPVVLAERDPDWTTQNGLARYIAQARAELLLLPTKNVRPSKEPAGAGALFFVGSYTPSGGAAAPRGLIGTTPSFGAVVNAAEPVTGGGFRPGAPRRLAAGRQPCGRSLLDNGTSSLRLLCAAMPSRSGHFEPSALAPLPRCCYREARR